MGLCLLAMETWYVHTDHLHWLPVTHTGKSVPYVMYLTWYLLTVYFMASVKPIQGFLGWLSLSVFSLCASCFIGEGTAYVGRDVLCFIILIFLCCRCFLSQCLLLRSDRTVGLHLAVCWWYSNSLGSKHRYLARSRTFYESLMDFHRKFGPTSILSAVWRIVHF